MPNVKQAIASSNGVAYSLGFRIIVMCFWICVAARLNLPLDVALATNAWKAANSHGFCSFNNLSVSAVMERRRLTAVCGLEVAHFSFRSLAKLAKKQVPSPVTSTG